MKINIEYHIPHNKMEEIRAEVIEDLLAKEEHSHKMWLQYEPEVKILSEIISKGHDAGTVIVWANEYKALKAKYENQEVSMRALMEERDYLSHELRKHEAYIYTLTIKTKDDGTT